MIEKQLRYPAARPAVDCSAVKGYFTRYRVKEFLSSMLTPLWCEKPNLLVAETFQ